MCMSKGVIFRIFHRYPSIFCSLALFGFFALAGLNQQLNLNLPSSVKVRDEVDFSTAFATAEKLDIRAGTKEIASSFMAQVPTAGYSYTYAAPAASAATTSFHISEPVASGNLEYILDWSPMRFTSYGGRFLYGHSSTVFSPLKAFYSGSTFTATIDGVTSTYVIRARYEYTKAELNGNSGLRTAIYAARDPYSNVRHSLSLMTCGNGNNDDGNYRLVFFADKV